MNKEKTITNINKWHVLLFGTPKVKKKIALAPGLFLKPLDSRLTVFDLAAIGAVGFREWSMLESIANGCNAEIETVSTPSALSGYDTLNRAWLVTALLFLKGYSTTLGTAFSSYSWNRVAGFQTRIMRNLDKKERVLPKFKGGLLDFHRALYLPKESKKESIDQKDIDWISSNYETFNKFAYESDAFRLALESAIDWRYAKNPRIAIVGLWAGIEAVIGTNNELAHKISLYCSSLLIERGKARKEFFNKVKSLYSLRSQAVHGARLKEEVLLDVYSDSIHLTPAPSGPAA